MTKKKKKFFKKKMLNKLKIKMQSLKKVKRYKKYVILNQQNAAINVRFKMENIIKQS